jgi:hypothetical protein
MKAYLINIAVLGLLFFGKSLADLGRKDNERYIKRQTADTIKDSTSRWTPYDDDESHPFGHLTRE